MVNVASDAMRVQQMQHMTDHTHTPFDEMTKHDSAQQKSRSYRIAPRGPTKNTIMVLVARVHITRPKMRGPSAYIDYK